MALSSAFVFEESPKEFSKQPIKLFTMALLFLFLDVLGLCLGHGLAAMVWDVSILPFEWVLAVEYAWVSLCVLLVFYVFDLYKADTFIEGMRPPVRSIVALCVASVLIFSVVTIKTFLLKQPLVISFEQLIFALSFYLIWSVTNRYFLSIWYREHCGKWRWLVLGPQADCEQFYKDCFDHNNTKDNLFVFLLNEELQGQSTLPSENVAVLKQIDDFIDNKWTGIILAHGFSDLPESIIEKILMARLRGVRTYNLTNFYQKFWNKVPAFYLKSGWFISASGFMLLHNQLGWRIKRVVDLFVTPLLLAMFSPVILLCFALIKIDSRGPVIFRQSRVGLNGKPFTLFKFRTMTHNNEGSIYTGKNDARITRLGKWLRLLRVDELPQLYNVLRGDMSLIGPRAEWTECVKRYEHVLPFYHFRHLVKPGITGWAQVMYPYGASVEDAKEKLQYDLYYIKNYSVFLDVSIFFKTVRIMILGKGQ